MIYRNENNMVHFPVCNLLIVFIFISDRHKICGWSILSVEGAVCERSEPLYQRSEVINGSQDGLPLNMDLSPASVGNYRHLFSRFVCSMNFNQHISY